MQYVLVDIDALAVGCPMKTIGSRKRPLNQVTLCQTCPFHKKANKECGWLPDIVAQLPFCQISDDGNEMTMMTMMTMIMMAAFIGRLLHVRNSIK